MTMALDGHDDFANSVAGCADLVASHRPMVITDEVMQRASQPPAYQRSRLTQLEPRQSNRQPKMKVFF